MLSRFSAAVLAVIISAHAVFAEGREYLGFGSSFVNDFLGDGFDRWRTGSYGTSRFWGYGWDGQLPEAAGDLLELRIGGEILSPLYMTDPMPSDRPWAGMLSAGLHTQFRRNRMEFAVGGDVLAIGPQTGLDHLQQFIHDVLGIPGPSDTVRAAQIPNQFLLRFVGEAGQEFQLGDRTRMRPFVEARIGDEDLVRAGIDFTFGNFGTGELLSRDWVTGNRYRSGPNQKKGLSWVVGADVAKVYRSVYLPKDRGFQLTDARGRVRAGVHWQGERHHVFYGVTYLTEEYTTQPEGQLTGSIRLDFRF